MSCGCSKCSACDGKKASSKMKKTSPKKKVKIKFITKTKTTTIRILRDTGEGELIDNLRKISCQVNISHEIKNIWKPKKQESTISKDFTT